MASFLDSIGYNGWVLPALLVIPLVGAIVVLLLPAREPADGTAGVESPAARQVAFWFFLFYVMWEVMLVPMYFIIGIWGGERRIYASIKFFLYTFLPSLLMLVAIIYLGLHLRGAGGVPDFSYDHLLAANTAVPQRAALW